MDFNAVRIPWNGWKAVRQIGKGTYGTVYEIDRTIGTYTEKAALKVISIPPNRQIINDYQSEGYDDASISAICESYLYRTIKEYEIMRSLDRNTNIVICEDIDYLVKEDSIGWDVYIRMELLTPFQESIKSSAYEFKEDEVIKLGKDLCQALSQCEKKNIIHRDIKPANIFVTDEGTYKLGDFGVARTLDHATHATRVGTERFMAPEVVKQEKYDNSIDIYSLGLVMYWLLNGRRLPFLKPNKVPSADELEVAQSKRLAGEAIPRPANGSKILQDIVLKACEYNREDRFASAKEMLQALTLVSENANTILVTRQEPSVDASISGSSQAEFLDGETQTNAWEEEKTVGKDFLDKHKEEVSDNSAQNTISPDWEDIKEETENRINVVKDTKEETYKDDRYSVSYGNNESVTLSDSYAPSSSPNRIIAIVFAVMVGLIISGIVLYFDTHEDSDNSNSNYYSLSESSTTIGDSSFETVTIGNLEWIVLAQEDGKALLLTKDILEDRPYNEEYESVTWENCTLRSYLNGTWYDTTFSDEEKAIIQTTTIENPDNSEYGTSGGNATQDKVFLLSIDEANQYFSSDDARIAKLNGDTDWWWLRSPGSDDDDAADVYYRGYVDADGFLVDDGSIGVRPALWINLES